MLRIMKVVAIARGQPLQAVRDLAPAGVRRPAAGPEMRQFGGRIPSILRGTALPHRPLFSNALSVFLCLPAVPTPADIAAARAQLCIVCLCHYCCCSFGSWRRRAMCAL